MEYTMMNRRFFFKALAAVTASLAVPVSAMANIVPFGVLDAIDAGLFVVLSSVPGHLIFSGLPGVIVLNTDLNQVLTDIDKGVINIYNFDQKKRLELCVQRFGLEAVVGQIESKVFQNQKI